MLSINEQLRAARKAKKMTQQELGQHLGWAQNRVSTIENGRTDPRLSNVIQVGRLLGHELMLVPSAMVPAVQTLFSGKTEEPLWSVDDDEGPAS
jgi:transcriptional regulator with XRE-family HTH domain